MIIEPLVNNKEAYVFNFVSIIPFSENNAYESQSSNFFK